MSARILRPEEHPDQATASDFGRFMAKVQVDPASGCWRWHGATDEDGYARFWFRGRNWHAARLSYMLAGNDLASWQEVDHACEQHSCVNPAHLEPVTKSENLRRRWQRHEARRLARKIAS